MKKIVIVGGSSGIGLALVQNLSKPDFELINVSRTPCAVAGVTNVQADVTDFEQVQSTLRKIEYMDVLVYCAGASLAAPIEYAEQKDVNTIFDTNIIGATVCIKAALPALEKSENPKIVLLSSSGGIAPIAFDSFYSATKAGLFALSVALRLECPKVKCTAIAVPATQTEFSFKRKVYTDCGEYNKRLKTASDALIKAEQTGYSADHVAKHVAAVIAKTDPPPIVTVGTKNKLMMFAYKILPWRIKLYALRKFYGI